METLLITGKGKNTFVQKLAELNSEIKSVEGIMVNIPESANIDMQEYLKMLNSLSSDEEVQISKLYC